MGTPISTPGTYSLSGDCYLANDINVAGGTALTFTGSSVRLNMAGRTVRNTAPHPTTMSIGIKGAGVTNLSIESGAITGFRHGVDSETPYTRVQAVDLSGNLYIGANLKGHTSRALYCTVNTIGGVTDEAYAIAFNIAGSGSSVVGNKITNIYRQNVAPESTGEGCPIIINSGAGACTVEQNFIENDEARPDTIGIYAGTGGAHEVNRNVIRGFKTGIWGGRQSTGPMTAVRNVLWMFNPLAGSRAFYGDYGSATEAVIIGYQTAFDGIIPHSGCFVG
jgi:hypothetical protein